MADNNIMSITNVKTVTIASGATGQSAEIDLTGSTLVAIVMPAAWTTANLTVLASTTSGGTFNPVYDESGNEYVITASTSRVITFAATPCVMAPLRYIKLRSGTAATPVDQTTTRTLYLITKG